MSWRATGLVAVSWFRGGDGPRHPGHGCQEGYVLKLLLKQNPDGSLTFFYGCVKDGGGIVTGPTDITSGAAEPVVAYVAWTGPDILTVPAVPGRVSTASGLPRVRVHPVRLGTVDAVEALTIARSAAKPRVETQG